MKEYFVFSLEKNDFKVIRSTTAHEREDTQTKRKTFSVTTWTTASSTYQLYMHGNGWVESQSKEGIDKEWKTESDFSRITTEFRRDVNGLLHLQ